MQLRHAARARTTFSSSTTGASYAVRSCSSPPDVVHVRSASANTDPQAAAVGASAGRFSAMVPVSEVAKTATYTHGYAEQNGFLALLSDGERLTGAYALDPEAGEWLQQATLAIRAHTPLDVLADTIQPFPTFSEIYVAALKALRGGITATPKAVGAGPPMAS